MLGPNTQVSAVQIQFRDLDFDLDWIGIWCSHLVFIIIRPRPVSFPAERVGDVGNLAELGFVLLQGLDRECRTWMQDDRLIVELGWALEDDVQGVAICAAPRSTRPPHRHLRRDTHRPKRIGRCPQTPGPRESGEARLRDGESGLAIVLCCPLDEPWSVVEVSGRHEERANFGQFGANVCQRCARHRVQRERRLQDFSGVDRKRKERSQFIWVAEKEVKIRTGRGRILPWRVCTDDGNGDDSKGPDVAAFVTERGQCELDPKAFYMSVRLRRTGAYDILTWAHIRICPRRPW